MTERAVSRAGNARRVTTAFGSMLLVTAGCFVAYAIDRNVRLRTRVERACAIIEEELHAPSEDNVADIAFARSRASTNTRSLCTRLRGELVWWRFNFVGGYQLAASADRSAEERITTMRRSCPIACSNDTSCVRVDVVAALAAPPREVRTAWGWAYGLIHIAQTLRPSSVDRLR